MSELTAEDDGFHGPPDDAWWWTETAWFWFFVPERRLGGWIHHWVRPNIGVCGGGWWIWDDTSFLHWDAPWYSNHHNLRIPADADLRDITFPTGVSLRCLEPLSTYELRYDRSSDPVAFDLRFDAVMEPWVSAVDGPAGRVPHHLDQFGRVHGRLDLHGEAIDVDCLAIRDRTWRVRSERWTEGGGHGYTSAMASSGEAFLSVGGDGDSTGFLVLDGRRSGFRGGRRTVERDPDHGFVTQVRVEATDDLGRQLDAHGRSVSRQAMPVPGVAGVAWTSLVEWTINGVRALGDDQEPWPIMTWSHARRRRHQPLR